MGERISARVPVADELIDDAGGADAFCRRITGMIVRGLEVDWRASRHAPLTVAEVVFLGLAPGTVVTGPGFAKVAAAYPLDDTDAPRACTYVCLTFEVVGPGESAADTSEEPRHA